MIYADEVDVGICGSSVKTSGQFIITIIAFIVTQCHVHIITSNSKVIITCLSTLYNVTIGIKQQCLFPLFMYFNNFETIIIREHLYSNIIVMQLIN